MTAAQPADPPAATERPGTAGSRKERAARTEEALKEVARRVFAEKGFLNAKISDISAEAGRSTGSFYNHFSGKEAVLEALLGDWIKEAGRSLAGHGVDLDLANPEHLRRHVAAVWRTHREHGAEIRALQEAALVDETFARRIAALQMRETSVLRDHLHEMERAGRVLPGRVELAATAMMGMLNEFSRNALLVEGVPGARAPGDDEAIDMLTEFVLHGISGPDPNAAP
ncbi:TetR/AcrR family transcriptional regulator [Streptomyces sp. NPDC002690]